MVLRDYIFHASTRSLCPECMCSVPAKVIERNKAIYLLKRCKIHGEMEEILEEDADYYLGRMKFEKPGNKIVSQTPFEKGCPFDCGLCPDHEQHTCIGLIEITEKCNLGCPVCYAHSGKGKSLDLPTIEKMMDFYIEKEGGQGEILQISGGEPGVHEDIIKIIELARTKKFKYVMVNTNGIRLAQDEEFAKALGKFKGNFEIYLQFDSLNDDNYQAIRGRKLIDIKKKALEHLAKYEIPTTLVATVERGVNDNELGEIINFAMNTPFVRGINFQPLAFFGRLKDNHKIKERLTLTGLMHLLEQQTQGMIKVKNFVPLPCDTDRVAINYLVRTKKNEFLPVTDFLKVENYLEVIDNTLVFKAEELIDAGKENLFSGAICDCFDYFKKIKSIIPGGFSKMSLEQRMNFVNKNTFRITITSFVDAYNFEEHAMKKECVHIITPDLKRIPFSSFNILHRQKYLYVSSG